MMFKVIFKFLKQCPSFFSSFNSFTVRNETGKNSVEGALMIVKSSDSSHDFGSDLEVYQISATCAEFAEPSPTHRD